MRNRWHVLLLMFCTVGLMAILPAPMAQAGVVAAWSFDSGSLTTDGGGNITAIADATGNHTATVNTGTFLGTDSVAGQFGEALRFNGDNNLYFPNLTELMMTAGAPSYTVSLWIKWDNATAPSGGTPFATLGNWGEGVDGTPNVSSRFVYAFGPNGASSIRAQTRRAGGAGSGDDIYAVSTTTPSAVNDGGWHMLTWTFDTTSGLLSIYFDGASVATANGSAPYVLADSTSAVGNMGHKGDAGADLLADTYLDEVVVMDEILDATAVAALYNNGFDFTSNKAQDPSPANGATLVPVDSTLSWEAPDDPNDEIVTYDVYFGTTVPDGNCDGPPLLSADQAATTYDPGILAFNTDYYWRVDVIDPNTPGTPFVVKGDCWTFKTAPATPVITADPEALTVDKGATAIFSISHTNGETFTWLKDGVDVTATGTGAKASIVSDGTMSTLTITNVQVVDEGTYSVMVSNGSGSVTSAEVQLITCRLVGHWKLDGDLSDSIQATEPDAPTHDGSIIGSADTGEAYDTGIDGQAFNFAGDPNSNAIVVTGGDDPNNYFNFGSRGLSVAFWALDTTQTSWEGLVSKQLEGTDGWFIDVADSSGDFQFRTREGLVAGSGVSAFSPADHVNPIDPNWHHVVSTYDPDADEGRIYVDGALAATDTSAGPLVETAVAVLIGAEASDGRTPFDGLLDDVRIYSCPLTPTEVATLYTDVAAGSICIDAAGLDGFDYNGDCIVNLIDFSTLAGEYLNCQRIPTSACP